MRSVSQPIEWTKKTVGEYEPIQMTKSKHQKTKHKQTLENYTGNKRPSFWTNTKHDTMDYNIIRSFNQFIRKIFVTKVHDQVPREKFLWTTKFPTYFWVQLEKVPKNRTISPTILSVKKNKTVTIALHTRKLNNNFKKKQAQMPNMVNLLNQTSA